MVEQHEGEGVRLTSASFRSLDEERVAVEVGGEWHGRSHRPSDSAMLIVEAEGSWHRYPAVPESRRAGIGRSGEWSARFVLPEHLLERLRTGAAATVVLGEESLPLPSPQPGAAPAAPVASGPEVSGVTLAPVDDAEALREEVARRAAAEARLRGEVADLRSQLVAQEAVQQRFEATQAELRSELDELRRVAGTRSAAEEAALAEAAALREELQRLEAELVLARAQLRGHEAGMEEAEALLADARALTATLRQHG